MKGWTNEELQAWDNWLKEKHPELSTFYRKVTLDFSEGSALSEKIKADSNKMRNNMGPTEIWTPKSLNQAKLGM